MQLLLCAAGLLLGVGVTVAGVRALEREATPLDAAPVTMVPIVAGNVVLRSSPGGEREDAGTPVGAFEIDVLEVSVADYDKCVRAGACVAYASSTLYELEHGWHPADTSMDRHFESSQCRGGRPDRASEPMNCVDWHNADHYCKWVRKRLPSREEWWLAVGARHPAGALELHRTTTGRRVTNGEWTASPARVGRDGPWPELHFVALWSGMEESNGRIWDDWVPSSTRSASLGFRCAR